MGKPKVEMATAESVTEVKEALEQLRAECNARDQSLEDRAVKIEKSIEALKQELSGKIRTVESQTEHHAGDIRDAADHRRSLEDNIKKEVEKHQEQQAYLKTLESHLKGVEQIAQQNYEVLEHMQKQAEQERIEELNMAKEELHQHAIETARKDADTVQAKAHQELEGATTTVRNEMSTGLRDLEKRLNAALQKSYEALDVRLKEATEALEGRCSEVAAATEERRGALEVSVREQISKVEVETRTKAEQDLEAEKNSRQKQEAITAAEIKKMAASFKVSCDELEEDGKKCWGQVKDNQRDAESKISEALAESRAGIQLLEAESSRLNAFCAGVSGLPTRQVEWRISEDVLKSLERVQDRRSVVAPSLTGDAQTSFFSPPFEAAGTRGMQLELRVHTRRPNVEEQSKTGEDQCSLYLWAAPGLQLVFRLFLGSESVILRHTFNGKEPCGMKRMGAIVEQKAIDGSLRLGIEIHESLLESAVTGEVGTSNPMAVQVIQREAPHRPVDGTLSVQRYLNHRLLELMQSQGRGMLDQLQRKVDQVRSRATRRVQWRLENAPLLRQSFGQDQAVRSTAFQAAGISGLQLVFYPSGYAGARPGFCSVFLSCPPGCTVRCWLWAGRWRREARAEPEDKPDMLGRVNFCRFENVVDPVDESVELALEIEEAKQASKGGLVMSAADAPQSDLSPNNGASTHSVADASTKDPSNGLERADLATMKVQHNLATKPSQDGGVQQLPAIWTTQGFHTFGDIEELPADGKASSRAQTASTAMKGGLSPPATPMLPRPGTTATSGSGSRKSTPRKIKGGGAMSAREMAKYKEYDQVNHPLPAPSY
eukprot:TRINITY_DN107964_c0_g1_i1.p1 TRINITY_DN107964_c0_g1~~TRINITY_DN107964_c0_g1_i1.p1  ORF type:complete len:829 (-),score=211.88 TRINITY_DN107964_c0_g1_i1:72-2558(-)